MSFVANKEPNLTIARRFSERFDYGLLTVEKFDMWIIDQRLVEDPETEDTGDPRYKAFRDGRSKVMGTLNRYGGECDDGFRFQIKVVDRGKVYRIVPFSAAMLEDSLSVGVDTVKFLSSKTTKLAKAEKKVAELAMLGGGDQAELMEVARIQAAVNTNSEKIEREVRNLMHKKTRDEDKAAELMVKLLEKYDPEADVG